MRLSPGCGERSGRVVKLPKCHYGLNQVGNEWYLLLVKWLVEVMDLEQCKADTFISRQLVNGKVAMMVGVHVDNIIVSGEKDACDKFHKEL